METSRYIVNNYIVKKLTKQELFLTHLLRRVKIGVGLPFFLTCKLSVLLKCCERFN